MDTPETWVIMDRHFAGAMKRFGLACEIFFVQATVLRLPLSDFFKDVYENKILEVADELFSNEKNIKKLIKREIDKT